MEIYKNKFTKAIELKETKQPGIFSVMLYDGYSVKRIGKFNEVSKTFSTFRSEAKHLHRKSGSLAVNEAVLNELNPRWVEVIYTDSNGRVRRLATSRDYLIAHGKRFSFKSTDFEKQIFLSLSEWSMEKVIRFEQQLRSQGSFSFQGA